MAKWVINGKFMADRMQGIVRYARELTKALDEIVEDGYMEIVIPPNAHDVPDLKHIKVIESGKHTGVIWEQLDFGRYMRRHGQSRAVNFCNIAPLFIQPGVTTIHDVMYKVNPQDYTTVRNKVSRLWHVFQYSYITAHELSIITVSEFSKGEIERYYPKACGNITVVPDAWQHVLEYEVSPDWQERHPKLRPGEYYFSMATLARNKNGRWVYEVAKRNPNAVFAMAGKRYEGDEIEPPPNVHLLGFVSDADACALIKNCKAFLFPSLYEGFGLPPLEALALGASVVASNTTSLPEVLGKAAHYVDPCDYEIDLESLLSGPVESADEALSRFSWQFSAEKACVTLQNLASQTAGDSMLAVGPIRNEFANSFAVSRFPHGSKTE